MAWLLILQLASGVLISTEATEIECRAAVDAAAHLAQPGVVLRWTDGEEIVGINCVGQTIDCDEEGDYAW